MLSRTAAEFAAEIRNHDWSDAPYRADRAGHKHGVDTPSKISDRVLSPDEDDRVRMNVMWVVGQVLGYQDPNFDEYEFAEACGVSTVTSSGRRDRGIAAGFRRLGDQFCRPGTWETDPPAPK